MVYSIIIMSYIYILLFRWCNYSYYIECSVKEEGEILCSLEVVYDGGTGEEMRLW